MCGPGGRATDLPPDHAVPSRRTLGGAVGEGESPVGEGAGRRDRVREYHRARGIRWEAGTPTFQGARAGATDSGEYREGTVKRTPVRGVKQTLKPHADERSEGRGGNPALMACLLKNEPASCCIWQGKSF